MKQIGFVCCAFMACAILFLVSGGCMSVPNTPNPRFYTLGAIGENQAAQKFNIAPNTIIGVGPVRIPEYLNRPQIVTKDEEGMLTFAQFDRWGEPLDLALSRLISANLTLLLPGVNMEVYPWNIAIPVEYQVLADVVQLESELDKDLFFAAQWSLLDAQNNKMLFTKRFEFRKPIEPHSYSGLVGTLSMACASLSRDIAEAVATLAKEPEIKK